MGDDSWDTSDFLKRYTTQTNNTTTTTNSNNNSNNNNNNNNNNYAEMNHTHDEEMNSSMESEMARGVDSYHTYNENIFCTPANLEERLQYLNQELTILGFPTIFGNGPKDLNGNFDVTKLVNCTYDLLKRNSIQVKIKDDLEARQVRSDNDNDVLLQTQDRLKQENESLKRDNALSSYREKDLSKKCACLQHEIKNEREEKRKMKSDTDHLRKQFYHESKRLEKEISRLKDKVHQSLGDRSNQNQKVGIDILNPLLRQDGKRSRWKVGAKKDEEEMYRQVIANYEENKRVLLVENEEMRGCLNELHRNLSGVEPSFNSEEFDEETSKQYQMPFQLVKEDVNSKLQFMLTTLKNKMAQSEEKSKEGGMQSDGSNSTVSDETHKQLLAKLEQCKTIIMGQERTIQGLKDGHTDETFEKLLTAFGTREDDIIEYEERRRLMEEERKKYEEDRKQFTAYVVKVAKEKEELEREKVEFYMQCISTPVINKETKGLKVSSAQKVGSLKGSANRSCPATPNFSAAPRRTGSVKKSKTPSTSELYKYMSLNYESTSPKKQTALLNFDGSFSFQEQPQQQNNSPIRRNSSRKVREHSDKIRKAVEERKHIGDGGVEKRNILSELENVK